MAIATATASLKYFFLNILQVIAGKELTNGGIKMWLYNTDSRSGENLTVQFLDTRATPESPVTVSQFKISLKFEVTNCICLCKK